MGTSLPPGTATLDLVGSYARLRGPDVEIVLADPQHEGLGGLGSETGLTLRRKGRQVAGTASLVGAAGGARLVGHAPRADLTDGTWRLVVETDAGPWRVDVRLLVQGRRPVVLLWGGTDQPGLEPTPRGPAPSGRRRAARRAGRVLDRALAPLPGPAAARVRAGARGVARRVLR